MESTIDFIESNWDDNSDLSTLHLSCLINSLLPLQEIKLKISSDLNCKMSKELFQLCGFREVILTGSGSEGFGIPSYLYRHEATQELAMEMLADVDALLMTEGLVCTSKTAYNPTIPECLGYFEYVEDSPGYVRICVVNPDANNEEVIVVDPVSNKRYLSLTKYMDAFCMEDLPTFPIQQGPAITMSSFFTKLNPDSGAFCDLVFAIPCLPWPVIAADWKKRVETSTWLTPQVVNAIIKDGCHVVAAPSKISENPELEWRISFSASEGRLAQEAVTDYQRQCFIYIKILHHQKTKRKGILSSYMFKSVFLHCCEKLPVNYWKDHQGSCILYILDSLIECLRRRHVPTYFLPENNLIRHLSDDEIRESIKDVESLRKDPITPALEFTDDKSFPYHTTTVPFRQMIAPLLEDIAAYKDHTDQTRTLEIAEKIRNQFQRCQSPIVDYANMEGNIALPVFKDLVRKVMTIYYTIFKTSNPNVSMSQFFKFIRGAVPNLPIEWLHLYEAAVGLSGEYPELASERGTLASLYHAANYLPQLSKEKKEEYMDKAEELFKVVYEESGESVVDYAAYLVKQDKLKHARCILEKFLVGRKIKRDSQVYWYDSKFKDCLVEPLKIHIETNGYISGDDVSFAYFYCVYCIINDQPTDSSKNTEAVLREFEEYYANKKDNETFVILKYTKMLTQNTQENLRTSLEMTLD